MKIPERTLRISAASLLALLMVSSAYLLSGPSFFSQKFANAGSTEELLKAYAAKDTDGDGLPDWQEALYGTDPNKAISNSFGIPDGQAAKEGKLTPQTAASQLPSGEQGTTTLTAADLPGVDPAPGSITEQFSQEFLQKYLDASRGQPLTPEQQQALALKLLGEFTVKASALYGSTYTTISLHTDPSVSITAYADSVEGVLRTNDVPADANQPIPLLEALIEKNDESARPKIKRLSESYASITKDLLDLRIPPQLANQHLELVRGFDQLHKASASAVTYEKDPLAFMGALSNFQPSSVLVVKGFKDIATVILSSGEPAAGTAGSVIVSIARSAETQ